MAFTLLDLALYAGALFILFITPGPVWLAVMARTMAGGFRAAWPLALGVAVGDAIWPLVAILGVTWLAATFTWFLLALKWVAVLMFLVMGILVIRSAGKAIGEDSRLTRPGMWAGFAAGLAAVIANPKAALFYMALLPGFFDVSRVTWVDIAVIIPISMAVPFLGNLMLAAFVDRMRRLVRSPAALRRLNLAAGGLLIAVGFVIPFT
ncbi:Transporter, LysE family [Candidatus Rhodobacter oscarellae]|uniref:Transporter, LysE family n=1 Tax=Candidatus Rhodobacter oscarellae TaxID=1675527 RepID=A0A0J9GZT8_9RHOB|nr:LysE family translocator [Candidatus Rhodobacter lobularis]KMW59013.1 Transporter, LysE family [Candidatus Rhodobacter lobularis]